MRTAGFIGAAGLVLGLAAILVLRSGPDPEARARLRSLEHRAVLSPAAISASSAAGEALPDPADWKGAGASVLALVDGVGLYRKNGLVEVYGGALRPRQSGPIRVTRTEIDVTHDRALVAWSPDASPVRDATHLLVELAEPLEHGTLRVGFVLDDQATVAFERKFGGPLPSPESPLLEPLVPEELVGALDTAIVLEFDEARNGRLVAALPSELLAWFRSQDEPIRTWYVEIEGAAGSAVALEDVALVRPAPETRADGVLLAGAVIGAELTPGLKVTLLREDGTSDARVLSSDGRFAFEGVPLGDPVSISLRYDLERHESSLGRWFVPAYSRDDVLIDLAPRYVNEDGHAADPSQSHFVTPREPTESGAVYESHARLVWPGSGNPQEYDSITFTNNFGYVDRDRFVDNPDDCLRVVHLGSSHAVALQVRPFEKYNILLEEELGVRLGRCVEVLHAGRDNGDIGANYGSLRDYAMRFSPDFIVIETSLALIGQLHPDLLRAGWGWDHDHSGIGNFYYAEDGELSWRPPSPEYPIYAVEPSLLELVPGVPFFSTFLLPPDRYPEQVREAFAYLVAITKHLEREFPDTRIVLQSALDQAQARSRGRYEIDLPTGETVMLGAEEFVTTFAALCEEHQLECVNPPVPAGHGEERTLLTFVNDGHYSQRGHQWLATELAEALVALGADRDEGERASR